MCVSQAGIVSKRLIDQVDFWLIGYRNGPTPLVIYTDGIKHDNPFAGWTRQVLATVVMENGEQQHPMPHTAGAFLV